MLPAANNAASVCTAAWRTWHSMAARSELLRRQPMRSMISVVIIATSHRPGGAARRGGDSISMVGSLCLQSVGVQRRPAWATHLIFGGFKLPEFGVSDHQAIGAQASAAAPAVSSPDHHLSPPRHAPLGARCALARPSVRPHARAPPKSPRHAIIAPLPVVSFASAAVPSLVAHS